MEQCGAAALPDRRAKTDMGKTAFDLAGLNSEIKDTDVYRLLKPGTP